MHDQIFQPPPALTDQQLRLVEAYEQVGRTLDDLPYTEEFENLVHAVDPQAPPEDKPNGKTLRREIMRELFKLRKTARLPRLGPALTPPLSMHGEDIGLLEFLVHKHAGSLGRRDALPYTDAFDKLVDEFNHQSTCQNLSHHAVWRLVARVAK